MSVIAALLATTLAVPPPAPFLGELPKQKGVYELRHDWLLDGSITAAAALTWGLSEVAFKHSLAPATCRWCDRTPDGREALNGLDAWGRGARWELERQRAADTLSNVTLLAVPIAVVGAETYLTASHGALPELAVDSLIIAEAVALSGLFNQVVKFAAGRERPFVHALPEDQRPHTLKPEDNNLSFFSGHTQMTFAATVAAGTVAGLRGYEGRWMIWAIGLPLSVATAYLRMGADKHYLTDVVTGAVVGSAFGFLVPVLLHGRLDWRPTGMDGLEARLTAGPDGVALVGRF